MEKLLYTVEEAAEVLSISRSMVYCLMNRGEIASVKVGGLRRFSKDALFDYVKSLG
jgi:excisionase family DNA binding protein